MKKRFDFYSFIHKGVRGILSNLVISAGRTNFKKLGEIDKLKREVDSVVVYLREHSHKEDKYITPLLREKAYPGLKELEEEHASSEKENALLVDGLEEIRELASAEEVEDEEARNAELVEKGYQYYLNLSGYQAEYFKHLLVEERDITPFLWKHYTDEELVKVHLELQGNAAKKEIVDGIPLIYPFITLEEVAFSLSGIRETFSEADVKEFCEITQRLLSEPDWAEVQKMVFPQEEAKVTDHLAVVKKTSPIHVGGKANSEGKVADAEMKFDN